MFQNSVFRLQILKLLEFYNWYSKGWARGLLGGEVFQRFQKINL